MDRNEVEQIINDLIKPLALKNDPSEVVLQHQLQAMEKKLMQKIDQLKKKPSGEESPPTVSGITLARPNVF